MLRFLKTRVGIALVIAVAAIASAAVMASVDKRDGTEKPESAILIEKIAQKSFENDADQDGLKNWEEALYGTDPERGDSDSDGVNDGDEIAANRDPLVTGSGQPTASSTTVTAPSRFNATDRFSQELFAQYMEAKEAGLEITDDLATQIAENVISQDYTGSDIPRYSESIFPKTEDSRESIVAYVNRVGTITSTSLPQGAIDELTALRLAAEEEIAIEAVDFSPNIKRYRTMLTALLEVKVPRSLVAAHGKVVNGMSTIIYAVEGMAVLASDPINALSRIPLHEDGVDLIQAGALEIAGILRSQGITLSPSDPGYRIIE